LTVTRRDGAVPDGIRRLESAKFLTKGAQRAGLATAIPDSGGSATGG